MEEKMRLPDIKTEELSVEQSVLLEAMQRSAAARVDALIAEFEEIWRFTYKLRDYA